MFNYRTSTSYRIFTLANYLFLTVLALSCVLPLIHVLMVSFSSAQAVAAGRVGLWPIDFTWASYESVFAKKAYLLAFLVSLKRIALGVPINMLLAVTLAYALSKESRQFRFRTFYAWLFVATILFEGGLVPYYIIVKQTGLINSLWALVIPNALNVFNVILLLNFFRSLPKELEESATIDGANHWTVLWRIFVPISLPGLATILLFTIISHWNSWFDGLIFMNNPDGYPLQTYLQTHVIQKNANISEMSEEELRQYFRINERTARAAQIFVAALPILLIYPFLQKYFMKGIVLGSVKE
ncbi:carbohydrate ABC transporter permease [Paenibacillus cymbidii]|uniref:carbohydrate ABC transporter permease n=1 Tax=Paenibacillus cymbidii TaxID=1639034 RepID=UPI001F3F4CC3|nr:carbohydrate ABC transporter permease [Paenibacillus cymbidii]